MAYMMKVRPERMPDLRAAVTLATSHDGQDCTCCLLANVYNVDQALFQCPENCGCHR